MKQLDKESARGNSLLSANVARNMSLLGIKNKSELARRMQLNIKTLSKKLNDPEKLTLKELRRLVYVLQFSEQEKNDVWGGTA